MFKKIFGLLSVGALFLPQLAYGEMTSTNYTIIFDAIGVAGGGYSTSTSYSLSDTVGEVGAGTVTSTSYTVEGGYQSAYFGTLSYSLDTNTVNLGSLSTSAINSANVVATVSVDNSGYTLSMANVNGVMPAAVVGGVMVAGTEAYGVSASGAHSAVAGDVPVTNGLLVSSSTAAVSGEQTTITFKATAGSASTPGNYSQTIDLVASAN
jgi:hypothetical protein